MAYLKQSTKDGQTRMLCSKKVSIKNEGQIKITEKQNNIFFQKKQK